MALSIDEFCTLVNIITKRHGEDVMLAPQDGDGHAHFQKDGKHLGYIDIETGSLVWDEGI